MPITSLASLPTGGNSGVATPAPAAAAGGDTAAPAMSKEEEGLQESDELLIF